jgi:hypothetical protein
MSGLAARRGYSRNIGQTLRKKEFGLLAIRQQRAMKLDEFVYQSLQPATTPAAELFADVPLFLPEDPAGGCFGFD